MVAWVSDPRIRDESDFVIHRNYVHMNPVRRHLVEQPEQYRFSSAYASYEVDPFPAAAKAAETLPSLRHG